MFEDENGKIIEVEEGQDPLSAIMASMTEDLKAEGVEVAEILDREPLEGVCFYIKIPEAIGPLDRGEKYEEPLWDAFEKEEGLGEITGGGTMLDKDKKVSYCGIDVTVTDTEKGLAVMRKVLLDQGAPEDTVLIELGPEEIEHPLA